ncbi:unnamed protein product, partial [Adineta steineri]
NNKSAEEITSELFTSLNLTAANFGGQLSNIETYRLALDKMIQAAFATVNQSSLSNISTTKKQQVDISTTTTTEEEQQTSATTTTDTREYTEKRPETKHKP